MERSSSSPEVGRTLRPDLPANQRGRAAAANRPTSVTDSASRPASANRGGLGDDDRRATRPTTTDASHEPAGSIRADEGTSAGASAETPPICHDRLSSRRLGAVAASVFAVAGGSARHPEAHYQTLWSGWNGLPWGFWPNILMKSPKAPKP